MLFEAAFAAIARDGAGQVEVVVKLRRALAELAQAGSEDVVDAAQVMADIAFEYAQRALPLERELERVKAIDV